MGKNINKELGEGKDNICSYCHAKVKAEELNYEGMIHHHATLLRCINRKLCERRKRKLRNKAKVSK